MISSYLILALAIIFSSLDKWISRSFLKKEPLCNEYLLTYQVTCSVLSGVLIFIEIEHTPAPIDKKIELGTLLLLILSSVASWMGFAYSTFRARASIELGVVSIISKTKIIWSVLFGFIFFNERPTLLQIIGGLLILFASLLIEKTNNGHARFFNNRHAWIAPIFLTLAIGIDKTLTLYLPSSIILFIGFSGTVFLTPLLFKIHYELLNKVAANAVIAASFGALNYYLLLELLDTSTFSLVMVLFQSSFVLDIVFGYLFLKERTKFKRKVISCFLTTLGIFILAS